MAFQAVIGFGMRRMGIKPLDSFVILRRINNGIASVATEARLFDGVCRNRLPLFIRMNGLQASRRSIARRYSRTSILAT